MSYVYRKAQPGTYTVGFYAPDGSWHADSEHTTAGSAAARVAWLNGSPPPMAARVVIHGMYDCHLFHRLEGRTPWQVIQSWMRHNAAPPSRRLEKDGEPVNLGPSSLCPAIVLDAQGKELRRVGSMVHSHWSPEKVEQALTQYRRELNADPDIPRILVRQELEGLFGESGDE